MAFVAGNIHVAAIQFKPCPVVIELHGFPMVETMAGLAIGRPVHGELLTVNIRVTTGARMVQPGKYLGYGS